MDNKEKLTLEYYNNNASKFVSGTVDVEFTEMQDKFLARLKPGARVLDFGCGSGRDAKYFLNKGFKVTATDGSEELCKIAGELTGLEVKQMLFDELDEKEAYDGVWACASILHVPYDQLVSVMQKVADALFPGGVFYTSFKYGDFAGERNGRFFTDLTEETLEVLVDKVDGLCIDETWVSADVRPGRENEKWLNVFMRKTK